MLHISEKLCMTESKASAARVALQDCHHSLRIDVKDCIPKRDRKWYCFVIASLSIFLLHKGVEIVATLDYVDLITIHNSPIRNAYAFPMPNAVLDFSEILNVLK